MSTHPSSRIDLRQEQIALLRHERRLVGAARDLAAGRPADRAAILAGAAVAATAGLAAADKLGAPALADFARANADAASLAADASLILALARVATAAHAAFEAAAAGAGAILLVQGGTPKEPPAEAVLSILGLG